MRNNTQDCCDLCRATPGCNSFTFNGVFGSPLNFCWTKRSAIGRTFHSGLISGNCTKPDSDAERTATPGAPPPPDCTDWAARVPAVLAQFLPGQEEGNAFLDVVLGEVEPSGRLALTIPNIDNELNFSKAMYPGLARGKELIADYSEKLNVGYRYYNAHNIAPRFAFGHGLSYTTFAFTAPAADGRNITFDITNTGDRAGTCTPQLYLTFPAASGEPPRQLKGFQKVPLAPGARARVSFALSDRALSVWDTTQRAWVLQRGRFRAAVGVSSTDLRFEIDVVVD